MKIALVTGSNRGIGLEIAKKLLKLDFFVYFGARNEEKCQKVLDQIGDKNADFILIDYDNHSTFENAAEKILHAYGGLDVLIFNAAIASKLRMNFNEVIHDSLFFSSFVILIFRTIRYSNGCRVNAYSPLNSPRIYWFF